MLMGSASSLPDGLAGQSLILNLRSCSSACRRLATITGLLIGDQLAHKCGAAGVPQRPSGLRGAPSWRRESRATPGTKAEGAASPLLGTARNGIMPVGSCPQQACRGVTFGVHPRVRESMGQEQMHTQSQQPPQHQDQQPGIESEMTPRPQA